MAYIEREKARELIINFGKGAIEDGMKNLDLITRQQAENENLKVENQSLRSAANSLKMHYEEAQAEVERLKEFIVETRRCDKEIKSEARKEFAERLCEDRVSNDPVVIAAKCLLKEMVRDDNA